MLGSLGMLGLDHPGTVDPARVRAHESRIAAEVAGAPAHGRAALIALQSLDTRVRTLAVLERASTGLPRLGANGSLPAGIHAASWGEFAARFGTGERRAHLLGQLRGTFDAFHAAGIESAVVGGSFVTAKPAPGDVDIAFVAPKDTHPLTVARAVGTVPANEVHPYPAQGIGSTRSMAGAVAGETFLEFFQHDRTGAKRGVVLLSTAPEGEAARAAGGAARGAIRAALAALRVVGPG